MSRDAGRRCYLLLCAARRIPGAPRAGPSAANAARQVALLRCQWVPFRLLPNFQLPKLGLSCNLAATTTFDYNHFFFVTAYNQLDVSLLLDLV